MMVPTLTAAAATWFRPAASVAPVAEPAYGAPVAARANLRGEGSRHSDKEVIPLEYRGVPDFTKTYPFS